MTAPAVEEKEAEEPVRYASNRMAAAARQVSSDRLLRQAKLEGEAWRRGHADDED